MDGAAPIWSGRPEVTRSRGRIAALEGRRAWDDVHEFPDAVGDVPRVGGIGPEGEGLPQFLGGDLVRSSRPDTDQLGVPEQERAHPYAQLAGRLRR